MSSRGTRARTAFEATLVVVAIAAYLAVTVGDIALLRLPQLGPPSSMSTPVAVVLVVLSLVVFREACRHLGRSLAPRIGEGDSQPLGAGWMDLAALPFLLFIPCLLALGAGGKINTYPGVLVVFVAAAALPGVAGLNGRAGVAVTTAVGWLVVVGSALAMPPPWPDVGVTVFAVAGWTAYGLDGRRRSVSERRHLGAQQRATGPAAHVGVENERRETARIAARKGRRGLAIAYDPRRWDVVPPVERHDADAAVGRVVLVHRPPAETSPLPVTVEVRRAVGDAETTLRTLSGIDDPGVVGLAEPENHRSRSGQEVLHVLVRVPGDHGSTGPGAPSVLTHVWRATAHASDVRVRASSRDERRLMATGEDIDALVEAVRFV